MTVGWRPDSVIIRASRDSPVLVAGRTNAGVEQWPVGNAAHKSGGEQDEIKTEKSKRVRFGSGKLLFVVKTCCFHEVPDGFK